MNNGIRYAEGMKILPILKPQDIAATATASSYVHLDHSHWATFLVQFGNMTSDSTDTATITVESSTAATSNATETAIAFNYRLASAIDTDSMGAITAAAAAGVAHPATGDNKLYVIDVDPAVVNADDATAAWVRVVITPNAQMAICLVNVIAVLEDRFPGNSIPSST